MFARTGLWLACCPLPLSTALDPWLPTTEPPVAEQPPRVCWSPAFYKIPHLTGSTCLLTAVHACVLDGCLGAGVFCMFSDLSVCCLPSTHLSPTVPPWWSRAHARTQCFHSPLPCLVQSTLPVHLTCPWLSTLLSCLERIHNVFYALTLPSPQRTRWLPPAPFPPPLSLSPRPLCSCVRWCVSVSLACHVM